MTPRQRQAGLGSKKSDYRFFALALFLFVLTLMLTACNLTEAPSHATYTYSNIASLPKDHLTSPGDTAFTYPVGGEVPLSWSAQPGQDTLANKPTAIQIDAGIVGPFTSMDELKKAISFDGNTIKGRIQATIQPIKTDNWNGKNAETFLKLPTTIQPGYYMIVQRIQTAGQRTQAVVPTGRVLKITPQS
ncbi:hypothetical protein [Ktedonospora formicarum]|uniref:Uncharacterized protein n=1 Tax=Ktedonospora formicarum TaxID=2778364 RepID=A0A8J3MTT6_9CHLR|nr:hypothetical protein [Ktedonospora formicarum]GHO46256.1 hypothetical protein KSX_44190 [Ktedonospora formicarum]